MWLSLLQCSLYNQQLPLPYLKNVDIISFQNNKNLFKIVSLTLCVNIVPIHLSTITTCWLISKFQQARSWLTIDVDMQSPIKRLLLVRHSIEKFTTISIYPQHNTQIRPLSCKCKKVTIYNQSNKDILINSWKTYKRKIWHKISNFSKVHFLVLLTVPETARVVLSRLEFDITTIPSKRVCVTLKLTAHIYRVDLWYCIRSFAKVLHHQISWSYIVGWKVWISHPTGYTTKIKY